MTADDLGGIMSRNTLSVAVTRGNATRVRRGCFETPALYAVDSLPYKYRKQVYERFPDMAAQEKARPFIDEVAIDGRAADFFSQYTTPDGRHLPELKQTELTNNASILNAFEAVLQRSDSRRAASSHGRKSRGEFWAEAAQALPRLADSFPNSLPQNARRLQEKFNQYKKDGYGVFISGNMGNANAGKIVTEEQRSIILSLYKAGNNLDYVQIANMYNAIAERMKWPAISASGAAAYLRKYGADAFAGRQGARTFKNEKQMQAARVRPQGAMLMWVHDGWTCELYYRSEDGSYTNRMTLEVILDPCCDYPIGYAIGSQENAELIKAALRNAVCHTVELFGARYTPYQMQYDNYAKKTLTPVYEATGHHLTPAEVGNAKSKVIEPYFKHLNKNYCQYMVNWSGFGVKSRKDCQPSPDWLNRNKSKFPDEQGVLEQIRNIIEMERAAKREEYLAMWAKTDAQHRLQMSTEQFLLIYGHETGRRNVLEGCGLRPTIEGVKYQYDCFDKEFRRHADIRWIVKYDPSDMSRALAVSEDGVYRYMLEQKYSQPMALAERKEGDAQQLQRIRDFNREYIADIAVKVSHADEVAMKVFEHNSELDNTLGKHIITNAVGQHKDLVSRKRLQEAKAAAASPALIEVESPAETGTHGLGKRREASGEDDETFNRFEIY